MAMSFLELGFIDLDFRGFNRTCFARPRLLYQVPTYLALQDFVWVG
jgi:hypothetical protein